MIIKTVYTLFFCFLLINIYSQQWLPLEMHGGGKVTGLISHPTNKNIIYCRTDIAGIYKSDNKGDSWKQLLINVPKYSSHIFKVRSFVINPNNSNEMFFAAGNSAVGGGSGIWKSIDGGNSWQLKTELAAFSGNGDYRWADEVMVYKPSNTDIVFAGAQPRKDSGVVKNGGLYVSEDGGEKWNKVRFSTFDNKWISKLIFDPINDDLLYIAVANPKISDISTDGGLWSYQKSTGTLTRLYNHEVVDIDFDAVDKNTMIVIGVDGISISGDKGQTWSNTENPFGYRYTSFVTPHPTETNHWFFGGANGFYSNGIVEITDGLSTSHFTSYGKPNSINFNKILWPDYALGNTNVQPVFGGQLSNLFFSPLDISTVYFNNVWRCDDTSLLLIDKDNDDKNSNANWDWTFTAKGIYIMVTTRISPHPVNPDIYTINVADVNQYETLDNGGDMLYYGLMRKMNYSAVTKYFFDSTDLNATLKYTAGTDNLGNGTFNKTTNGTDWVELGSDFFDGSKVIQDLEIDPQNPNIVIVGLENTSLGSQVYRSQDGGHQWEAWDVGLSKEKFFKKWQAWPKLLQDADGSTYYVWNKQKLFKRSIEAESWQEITLPSSEVLRRVTTAQYLLGSIYLVYNQNELLYISHDYGESWSSYPLPYLDDSEFISVSPKGKKIIVARRSNFLKKRAFQVWLNNDIENNQQWETLSLSGHPSVSKTMTFINEDRLISLSRGQGAFITDFSETVGTEFDKAQINNFSVFPNPVNRILNIQQDSKLGNKKVIKLEIVDMNAQVVLRLNNQLNIKTMNIDVSFLRAGLYHIQFTLENKTTSTISFMKL